MIFKLFPLAVLLLLSNLLSAQKLEVRWFTDKGQQAFVNTEKKCWEVPHRSDTIFNYLRASFFVDSVPDTTLNVEHFTLMILPLNGSVSSRQIRGNAISSKFFWELDPGDKFLITNFTVSGAKGVNQVDGTWSGCIAEPLKKR